MAEVTKLSKAFVQALFPEKAEESRENGLIRWRWIS